VIDLHVHTTASDGLSSPEALVREAAAAGIRTLAVTDHDTTAAIPAVRAAARDAGLDVVAGIEVTAVAGGRDVHVLGYFVDPASAELAAFLVKQRADRRRRLEEMIGRLDRLGVPIDAGPLLAAAGRDPGRAMGRPMLAAALVAAGHATDFSDAFDRYLAEGRPAFVERLGASPADVVALIARAGGVASLAHPGRASNEATIRALVDAGLPAIEVYHPDHDQALQDQHARLARECGLLVTGGSDYHGPGTRRPDALGRIGLPEAEYARLSAFAAGSRRDA
jgi:predicted metal-dependent phosphoesterase TrpH